jgi:large subunit ribosomal protein L3
MRRCGVIAQKKGMTTVFLPSGEACPVTIFSLEGCAVISTRPSSREGMTSVQVGSGKAKNVTKPMRGHFAKNGVQPKQVLKEFLVPSQLAPEKGAQFTAEYFAEGEFVDVSGVTIGRGFAGGMKRHNFRGLRATHGVSVSHRSHGSTGNRKSPAKVFKNKKMAGHMGCVRITVQNLKVLDVDSHRGLLIVKGSVPGFEGGWVEINDALKKPLHNVDKDRGMVENVLTSSYSVAKEQDESLMPMVDDTVSKDEDNSQVSKNSEGDSLE